MRMHSTIVWLSWFVVFSSSPANKLVGETFLANTYVVLHTLVARGFQLKETITK